MHNQKRRVWGLIGICGMLGFAMLLAACGSSNSGSSATETTAERTSETAAETSENVNDVSFTVSTWGAAPLMQSAAESLGVWDELSVNGTEILGGAEALPLITSGDMQGATELGETPIAIALAHKIPLKIVWTTNDIPLQLVADKSVKSADDLKGEKIGDPSATVMQISVYEYLENHGISPNEVEFANLGGPEILSAFKSGAIAGSYMYPPFSTELVAAGGHVLEEKGASQVDVFSTSFIEDHPDVVQAWVCGIASVQEEALEDPQPIWKAISEQVEVPVKEMPELLPQDSIVPIDAMLGAEYLGQNGTYAKNIVKTGKYLKQLGEIEAEPTLAEANELIDPQFIEVVENGECP